MKHEIQRNVRLVSSKKKEEIGTRMSRECGLCERTFKMRTPFHRFCDRCKSENEMYRMAEWLPTGAIAC